MASRMDRLTLNDHVPADPPAELADKVAEAAADGDSVLLTGSADPSPVFAAVSRHSRLLQARIFHVGPPLDLTSMLRQVTADDGPADATLKRSFDALTAPGAGCERIVLFVAEAHLLPHATMRYIELALRAGPHLTVVLAGRNELLDTLALDGFAGLHNRTPVHFMLPDAGPAHTDLPSPSSMPSTLGLAATDGMTPPQLLACAAVAAGLAVVGMMSLSSPDSSATIALIGPGAAPSPVAGEPFPGHARTQPAPLAVAGPVQAPDNGNAVAQHMPGAVPLPSLAPDAEPTLAAEAPAAAGTVAVTPPGVPHASAPVSIPDVTDPSPGVQSHAEAGDAAHAPAQPHRAQGGAPGLLPESTSEAGSEVAEAAAAPELHPAMPSGPSADESGQADAPDPSTATVPAAEPAAKPDNTAAMPPSSA